MPESMRRGGRECALQILYQLDLQEALRAGWRELERVLSEYWRNFASEDPVDRVFAERLVRGVLGDLDAIDREVSECSSHWRVGRMTAVDRNLLRVATYEIQRCPDIPDRVSINEALEVAKRFSGQDAVAFINGILHQVAKRAAESGGGPA